jgi:hypothetical protein
VYDSPIERSCMVRKGESLVRPCRQFCLQCEEEFYVVRSVSLCALTHELVVFVTSRIRFLADMFIMEMY